MDPLADTSGSSSDGDVVQQFLRNLCEWLCVSMRIVLRLAIAIVVPLLVLSVLLRWYSSDRSSAVRLAFCVLRMDATSIYAIRHCLSPSA